MPIVVATYVSMEEDSLDPAAVAKALGLPDEIPVLPCSLRDRDSVEAVVKKAIELIVDDLRAGRGAAPPRPCQSGAAGDRFRRA